MNLLCPCGSGVDYASCCEPFLNNAATAQTAEMLMRSRYTAYTLSRTDYIKKTMKGLPLLRFNEKDSKRWSDRVIWIDLKILRASLDAGKAYVEFVARYIEGDRLQSIHENSEFIQEQGAWFYVNGVHLPSNSADENRKILRNESCPCKSQRKYKNCHGNRK